MAARHSNEMGCAQNICFQQVAYGVPLAAQGDADGSSVFAAVSIIEGGEELIRHAISLDWRRVSRFGGLTDFLGASDFRLLWMSCG
jgi:hypothetical protein